MLSGKGVWRDDLSLAQQRADTQITPGMPPEAAHHPCAGKALITIHASPASTKRGRTIRSSSSFVERPNVPMS